MKVQQLMIDNMGKAMRKSMKAMFKARDKRNSDSEDSNDRRG